MRLSLPAAALLLWTALPVNAEPATRARWLMGTLCEITVFSKDAQSAVSGAFDEIARIEGLLSTYIDDSEVSRLNRSNRAAATPVSAELWDVLSLSMGFARESGGAFDPTFASPPDARGYEKVRLFAQQRAVRLAPGARLDFGAIGKGYALDKAAAALRDAGVKSALLNFGGQILTLGAPPVGGRWPVRIDDELTLRVDGGSVATSGLSERPGHIKDPRDGRRVGRNGSVTVIAPTAAEADAWSTALFVGGLDALPKDFSGCALDLDSSPRPTRAGDCSDYLETQG